MKTYLDCIPCFFNQAIRTSRLVTTDEKLIKKVLDILGEVVKDIPMDNSPPETGRVVYRIIKEIIKNDDPYKEIKRKSTEQALKLYPEVKEFIQKSSDPLLSSIKAAIGGNIIDFGVNKTFNIKKELKNIFKIDFAINDYKIFLKLLKKTDKILYIGDNAGETVFDKILIEELNKLNKKVIYVVRGKPIINDVIYEDAIQAGIDKLAEIVNSGTDAPGSVLRTCSKEFNELFNSSNFIVSKGQGNYEALSEENKPIFFLLKVKCHIIARDIKVKEKEIVLKASDYLKKFYEKDRTF